MRMMSSLSVDEIIFFGLVGFMRINHWWSFKAKSYLNTYIKYIGFGFGLVWFYGMSTIVGYLMPNSNHTYILNIYELFWFGSMVYQPFLVI